MSGNKFKTGNSTRSKLTIAQVQDIRRLHRDGWSYRRIAEKMGYMIGTEQVARICRMESHARVPTEENMEELIPYLLQVQAERNAQDALEQAVREERARQGAGDAMLSELAQAPAAPAKLVPLQRRKPPLSPLDGGEGEAPADQGSGQSVKGQGPDELG